MLNHSGKPCNLERRTANSQGNFDRKQVVAVLTINVEKECKVKAPGGKKCSVKTRATAATT